MIEWKNEHVPHTHQAVVAFDTRAQVLLSNIKENLDE
jgi:hypothetical protein